MRKIFFLYIVITASFFSQIHYVSKAGSSIPPYSSWETASDSIFKAIDVAVDGDTIYISNGWYHECFEINKELTLIGQSRENTVISGRGLENYTIRVKKNTHFRHLKVYGKELLWDYDVTAIRSTADSISFIDCMVDSTYAGISSIGSVYMENVVINKCITGLNVANFDMEATTRIKNSIFNLARNGQGFSSSHYGNVIIENCEFKPADFNGIDFGVHAAFQLKSFVFKNNTVNSARQFCVYLEAVDSRPVITNNTFTNQWSDDLVSSSAIHSYKSNRPIITNNIFYNCNTGIYLVGMTHYQQDIDYNGFWNNTYNVIGSSAGDIAIIEYPMFMKNPEQGYEEPFDVHLQAYSRLIDKGDPLIIDVDGSRSDIGAYGGPGGASYEYQDLAPLTPREFIATVQDSSRGILLEWVANDESDLREYKIYRADKWEFEPSGDYLLITTSEDKLLDSTVEAGTRYYYMMTSVDSTGNESGATGKVTEILTGVEHEKNAPPGYGLKQNYPNPFNPSTTIEYELQRASKVLLEVYDIKGEKVATVVNSTRDAGKHAEKYEAGKKSSGVYFYRLQVFDINGKLVYSRENKMLLLK